MRHSDSHGGEAEPPSRRYPSRPSPAHRAPVRRGLPEGLARRARTVGLCTAAMAVAGIAAAGASLTSTAAPQPGTGSAITQGMDGTAAKGGDPRSRGARPAKATRGDRSDPNDLAGKSAAAPSGGPADSGRTAPGQPGKPPLAAGRVDSAQPIGGAGSGPDARLLADESAGEPRAESLRAHSLARRPGRISQAPVRTAASHLTQQPDPAPPGDTTPQPPSEPPSGPPAEPVAPAAPPPPAWTIPLLGAEISSCFGPRWGTFHKGIDFAAPINTPVHAVGAGTVEAAGWIFSGYGISVVINHGDGTLTHYAHLNETKVSTGQRVTANQVIGLEGSTGDSTGPHLHFEVHAGMWHQIEPGGWLLAHGVDFHGC